MMAEIGLETWQWHDDPARLTGALARGAVLVVPTESSYGLAVDPRDARGVEAIYRLKERERGKPFPLIAGNVDQIVQLGVDPAHTDLQAVARLWPAALTVVLPCAPGLPAAAGGSTLAVRIPAHDRLRQLLLTLGSPLTATSANRSSEAPLLDPAEIRRWLNERDVVLIDDGLLPGGPPSTLIERADRDWRVLRAGRFPAERLIEVIG
jgi:L-threonylcarbamoyladenylate synthase